SCQVENGRVIACFDSLKLSLGEGEGYRERRENTSGRAQIHQYGYRGSFFASKLFPACSWNKGHFT
ncbi:hypothetical protein Nmel_011948, partial [Mimus melanotis]